jgi:single-stranded DNA-binding protein
MSYSVTIVGFVGADPEQRQARNNGSKFTVLYVATQRSWKNAEDEWVSKVEWHRIAFNRLGESIAEALHKGDYVLVDGHQSSARSTSARTASPRRSRPPRSPSSRAFAPTPCGGSAARKPKFRCSRAAPKLAPNPAMGRSDSDAGRPSGFRPERLFSFVLHPCQKKQTSAPLVRNCRGYPSSAVALRSAEMQHRFFPETVVP